jgi:3-dehydroquinate synthase II
MTTKQVWIRLAQDASIELKSELLRNAEGRCNVAVVEPEDVELVGSLKLQTASKSSRSDITLFPVECCPDNLGNDKICGVEATVRDSSDEAKVLSLLDRGVRYLIIQCPDWKVIPFENLIARTRNKATLLADVSSLHEAKLALGALELGVDGIVLRAKSSEDLLAMDEYMRAQSGELQLASAKVVSIRSLGSGVRVCVDTCELMNPGEGLLVGSQSSGLFLVEAEVHRNPHVEPRPFRVNAGPVSSYVMTPGLRTRYLSELKAGDDVLIVNRSGSVKSGHIGRVKIERRPMILVETEVEGRQYSIILQNAETVRLVSNSTSKSVSELACGDKVLAFVEEGGRHFGTLVADEMVIER